MSSSKTRTAPQRGVKYDPKKNDEDIVKVNSVTNIEQIFYYEILVIKICAGFMFQIQPELAVLYRLIIMSLTRIYRPIDYPQGNSNVTKAAWQNLKIFWLMYSVCSSAIIVGSLITGYKYHNLVTILLRKQFNANLVGVGKNSRKEEINRIRVSGFIHYFRGFFTHKLSAGSDLRHRAKVETNQTGTLSRIKLLRILITTYLLMGAVGTLIREEASLHVRARVAAKARASAILNATSTSNNKRIASTFNQPSTNLTLTTLVTAVNESIALVAEPSPRSLSSFSHLWDRSLYKNGSLAQNILRLIFKLGICIIQSVFYTSQLYGSICVSLIITATLSDMLGNSCGHLVRSLTRYNDIECNQISSDLIGSEYRSSREPSPFLSSTSSSSTSSPNLNKITSSYRSDTSIDSTHTSKPFMVDNYQQVNNTSSHMLANQTSHDPIVIINLLIHMKDVLVAIRTSMSFDYLMILVFDIGRMMFLFCIFSAFVITQRRITLVVALTEFIRIVFGMLLTRLGYYWLHKSVRNLERQINERQYLNDETNTRRSKNKGTHDFPTNADQQYKVSCTRQESVAIYRLSTEIEELWPTEWYTPDINSCISQIFFVITFVATLHQLVEASGKVRAT